MRKTEPISNRIKARTFGYGLALLCGVILLTAGCASKQPQGPDALVADRIHELKQLVEDRVEDPARVEAMVAVLDEANQRVKAQAEQMDSQMQAMRDASRRYETTREELEAMASELERDTLEILDVLQAAHFEMKALVTEEEWVAVTQQERKFLGIF